MLFVLGFFVFVLRENIFKNRPCIFTMLISSHLGQRYGPSFGKKLNALCQLSLTEIGPVVLEKNIQM